ncbi:MAG: transglycosylase domain-containing protein [Christensenella sp.]|nr:transglycosylase domain-containing protein [Christensenella sp.]
MTPKKNFRDNINEFAGKAKDFFKTTGQKIKRVFSVNADKTNEKGSSYGEKPAKDEVKTYIPKKGKPFLHTPKKASTRKPGGIPTDETVVFSDHVSKTIKKSSIPHKEMTQEMPAIKGKKAIFKPREKKPNFVLGVILTTFKLALVAIFVVVAIGFGTLMGVANSYLDTTPELDINKIQDQSLSTKIYNQDGTKLLATYTGSENRDWAKLDEIPKNLRNAVIAVEDIRFYEHNGVDFRRLIGAFVSNLSSSKVEGGSTITQQLVKNKLLTNERSYKRKLQEAYLATELEKKYTKDEILEAYLNAIPLGGTIYGVKTAAKDYFGKDLASLNLREIVCIASITQNPSRYNPRTATYDKTEYLPKLINRMNIVAERMYWAGMITEEEYNNVVIPAEDYLAPECLVQNEDGTWKLKDDTDMVLKDGYLDTWKAEMNILPTSSTNELYQYPHFIEYVVSDVQTFLLEKEGLEDTEANRQKVDLEMRAGGYNIYCTIDTTIQETVQNTLSEYSGYPNLPDGVATEITDSNGNVTIQPQSAAVVIDNTTGYLVAIVGSRDTPTIRRSLNRANEGLQVGSSMKPLAVYGPAFDIGYGPVTPVANIPVPINGWILANGEVGAPDITGTQGPVDMRTAIVKSLNVAAARTLMDYVTIPTSVEYLHKLGIPDENITATGVGLALGGSEVTPIQMTAAYAAIANKGEYRQPVSFTKVLDANNNVILDTETDRDVHEAFKSSTAFMLTDVLEQAVNEGTGTEARLSGMTTAGKTGTVGNHKGVTFAGYTPYYSSMVWIGQDQNKSIGRYYGGGVAAPLWKEYMQKIHEGLEDKAIIDGTPEDFNIVNVTLCQYTGLLPSDGCPTFTGWLLDGTQPTQHCSSCSFMTETIKMCGISHQRFIEGVCPEESAYTITRTTGSFPEGSPYAQWTQLAQGKVSIVNADGTTTEISAEEAGDPNTDCTVHFPGWNATPSPSPTASASHPIPTVEPTPAPTPEPEPTVIPEE